MDITVNHKTYVVDEACSVEQLLGLVLRQEAKGIAVAINQNIVAKTDWSVHTLRQGDQVILITATQGG
ncbi:sulfur carrier protein ThiS [Pedobacter africanus]|uniref:Sulfur carrier protein ThiS n=1 Tax=Pedobacter africanus TaxID=151894 RepID=A0A1W2CM60_9SPHI|nr:sulfur carrier protein ThiS [Pedobacter africanus]SMC86271.1 sulfur carrier protein ThiS [Pedobacter africanus]